MHRLQFHRRNTKMRQLHIQHNSMHTSKKQSNTRMHRRIDSNTRQWRTMRRWNVNKNQLHMVRPLHRRTTTNMHNRQMHIRHITMHTTNTTSNMRRRNFRPNSRRLRRHSTKSMHRYQQRVIQWRECYMLSARNIKRMSI